MLNTHQQWICRQLADRGYETARQVCIADDGASIQTAVRESLGRADVVITTGGLGPTSDDITRDLIAHMLGRKLNFDPTVMEDIEAYFTQRKRPMPNSTRIQAMVPEGARVLVNKNGTAPGLAIEIAPNPLREGGKKSWLILLPGPPRELRPMFMETVLPLLLKEMPLEQAFVCRTLRTTGMGESAVEETIAPKLKELVGQGLQLGYCARIGQVDVRLIARGGQAESVVKQSEEIVREAIGGLIVATDDATLESTVVQLLTEKHKTLALAESCTGGLIAHRITDVPGASAVLWCGLVTYSNESKMQLTGVCEETLQQHGAVSAEVAKEMAEGARARSGADFAIAVTGIAGPGGGSAEKPVGTVFIALARAGGTTVEKKFNAFDRATFKSVTSQQALEMLRLSLQTIS